VADQRFRAIAVAQVEQPPRLCEIAVAIDPRRSADPQIQNPADAVVPMATLDAADHRTGIEKSSQAARTPPDCDCRFLTHTREFQYPAASSGILPPAHIPPSRMNGASTQIGVGGCQISARARQLVLEVLDSGRLSAGPMMARFEHEIATLHGRRHGLMCNSGTSALHIALAALKERDGWQDGDEVLVPAITFVATANVVLFNQLRPVFVDVEPDFFCLDPAQIERAITPRTRAIMPVHIGGLPSDMPAIMPIAGRRGLRVVEDSAEAMFVNVGGRPVGSFSEIACFSTYVAHTISTGVGGVCITDDEALLILMRSLMNHGRDPVYTRIDDDANAAGSQLLDIARGRFSFVRLGHSFRCTELEAALGVAEVEQREPAMISRRRVAQKLLAALQPFEDVLQLPRVRPNADHGFMFFALVLTRDDIPRDALIGYLEEHGIETRSLLPLINQPVYRRLFGSLDRRYPVAARLNERAFYIGCHPQMTDGDIDRIADTFRAFFAGE
jgi:dTDP-4-amino-4,6-dideoxygalactose transaminase